MKRPKNILAAIELLKANGFIVKHLNEADSLIYSFESPSNQWIVNPNFEKYEFEVSVYIDGRLTPTEDYGVKRMINKLYIYFQRPFTGEILIKEAL